MQGTPKGEPPEEEVLECPREQPLCYDTFFCVPQVEGEGLSALPGSPDIEECGKYQP